MRRLFREHKERIKFLAIWHTKWLGRLFVPLLILAVLSPFIVPSSSGATYTFIQDSWNSQTSNSALHPTNQSSWSEYFSKDGNILAGSNISLSSLGYTATDDGTFTTTGSASGGGFASGTNSQTQVLGSGASSSIKLGVASGGWSVSYNPSAGGDALKVSAVDSSGVYLAGHDSSPGNIQWRIEKRSLVDGSLISGFGTEGVISVNPGVYDDRILSIAIDSSYLYVAGIQTYAPAGSDEECSWSADTAWRVEKRDLATGALISSFGTNGVLIINPTVRGGNSDDVLSEIIIDGGSIYLAGLEQSYFAGGYCGDYWRILRIEKRSTTDGSLISGFGTGGVIVENVPNPSVYVNSVAISSSSLYLVSPTHPYGDYLIEKRSLADGSLVSGFGTGGILTEDLGTYGSVAKAVSVYGNALYVMGDRAAATSTAIRLEKRDLETGAFVSGFGLGGATESIVLSEPHVPVDFAVGLSGVYSISRTIGAYDNWYIEKRDLTDGDLDLGFASSGILRVDFGASSADTPLSVSLDSLTNSFFWSGIDSGFPDNQVRVEKRSLTSGALGVSYYSSGIFTSAPIDVGMGVVSWGNLSWTSSGGQTITIKARSGNQSNLSDATDWSFCSSITSGQALSTGGCVSSGHRYIQYQATLSTADTSVTPSLDSVTIGYNAYPSSQSLISSPYDAGDSTSVMGGIIWDEDVSLPSGTTVTLSLRTASTSSGLASSSWSGFANNTSNCTKTSATVTCTSLALPSEFRNGNDDRWFQYMVTLGSTGANTPTVESVSVKYVVNAPPEFDSGFGTNGITVLQDGSSSSTLGKVLINYAIRDPDTQNGVTPNAVLPTFEYNVGGGWQAINSEHLSSGDLSSKTVQEIAFNTHSATWDAKLGLPGLFVGNAQVRITLNDSEAANNIAQAVSSNFILDTRGPSVSGVVINGSSSTVQFSISDDSVISSYIVSSRSDLAADGVNAISGVSQAVSATSTSENLSWVPVGSPQESTLFLRAVDQYGNLSESSTTAPAVPGNFDLRDISNLRTGELREFISWAVYPSSSTAPFARYEVWRSTGGAWANIANITNTSTNYFADSNIVSSSTTYNYRVRNVSSNGSASQFSQEIGDLPDGQGGSDFTAPTISDVVVVQTQATWAKISWTTNELSNSYVDFSPLNTSFGLTASSSAYVINHEVILSGLTPSTNYYFRVRSFDVLNNIGMDDNGGGGYTFTTQGGPVISDVTPSIIDSVRATIVWNTDRPADSYIVYSSNLANLRSNTSVGQVGSPTLVSGPPYQHLVELTGLSPQTTYYFYVKSTDSSSNESVDNKSGEYYSFLTSNDLKAPVISNLGTPAISYNSFVVAWNTDELADGQLEWGESSGEYPHSTVRETSFSMGHSGVALGLEAQKKYYYRVRSRDFAGNETLSEEKSVTTVSKEERIIYSSNGGGGGMIIPEEDRTAPQIKNVVIDEVTSFTALVSFETNEPSLGHVLFGSGLDTYERAAASVNLSTKHEIKLDGLRMGTKYHLRARAQDKAGNAVVSEDKEFTTKYVTEALDGIAKVDDLGGYQDQIQNFIESIAPSIIPPYAADISVINVSEDSAEIVWKTNVPAFGSVFYSSEEEFQKASVDPYSKESGQSKEKSLNHKIRLGELLPLTKYHFQVKSYALPEAPSRSKDITFTTKAFKIKPEISKVTTKDFEIRWTTKVPATSFAEYRNRQTGNVGRFGNEDYVKSHSLKIEGLESGANYSVQVHGQDEKGNYMESDVVFIQTKTDSIAPKISQFRIDNALLPDRPDKLQSVVSWVTDEPATSVVYFEEGTGSVSDLKNKVSGSPQPDLAHMVIIPGLKPSTVYRIKIVSVDEAGNKTESPTRTILTPKSAKTVLDVILKNLQESFGFLQELR